jgi:hypothetical protein
MSEMLARLPERFQWTLHNVIAHPLSELLYQFGLVETAERVHDATMPADAVEEADRG